MTPPMPDLRRPAAVAGLIVVLLALKSWITAAAGLELHFDEAQYWEWSQQLDWSYYSKGPLVAWLIAASTTLFGHGEWQVRLFAWLASAVFLILLYALTLHVWNDHRAAWWTVILALTTPLYFTLGLVMTTDMFMLTCWTWALWASYRALIDNRQRAWLEAGAAVGLGALTKLSIGLLPFFVGLLVLLTPAWWHHLRSKQLWLGLGLMLLCMSPMLLWNAANDWVMLRHEGGHVEHAEWSLTRALEFLAGQWLALSPLVVILAIMALWRRPQPSGQRLLWYVSCAGLAFFILKAASDKVQLNWPSPVYIGFIVLFAGHIARFTTGRLRLFYGALAISVVMIVVGTFAERFGLAGKQDPLRKLKYWSAPISEIAAQSPQAQFVLTDTYRLAGELAFYWPERIAVYVTGNADRRFNQHDLWSPIDREAGRNGVYISQKRNPPPELAQAFEQCQPLEPLKITATNGSYIRTLYAHRCEGYQPILWPIPQRY